MNRPKQKGAILKATPAFRLEQQPVSTRWELAGSLQIFKALLDQVSGP